MPEKRPECSPSALPGQPECTALLVELQLGPQFRRPRGLFSGAAIEGVFDVVDNGQAQALLFRAPREGLAEHLLIMAGHALLPVAEGGGRLQQVGATSYHVRHGPVFPRDAAQGGLAARVQPLAAFVLLTQDGQHVEKGQPADPARSVPR
jgi:hypothetical protein